MIVNVLAIAAFVGSILIPRRNTFWGYVLEFTLGFIWLYPIIRRLAHNNGTPLSAKRYWIVSVINAIRWAARFAFSGDPYLDAHGWLGAIALLFTLTVVVTGVVMYRRQRNA